MSAVGRADANGGSGRAGDVHKTTPAKTNPAKPPGSGSATNPGPDRTLPPASTDSGQKIQGPALTITRAQLKLGSITLALHELILANRPPLEKSLNFNLRGEMSARLINQIELEVARLAPPGPGNTITPAGAARVSQLIIEEFRGDSQRGPLVRDAVLAAQEIRVRNNLLFLNDAAHQDPDFANLNGERPRAYLDDAAKWVMAS
jgi:hypothetical protein